MLVDRSQQGANAVYQFVADISIHCCDEDWKFGRTKSWKTRRIRAIMAVSALGASLFLQLESTHQHASPFKSPSKTQERLDTSILLLLTLSLMQIQTPLCPSTYSTLLLNQPKELHPCKTARSRRHLSNAISITQGTADMVNYLASLPIADPQETHHSLSPR